MNPVLDEFLRTIEVFKQKLKEFENKNFDQGNYNGLKKESHNLYRYAEYLFYAYTSHFNKEIKMEYPKINESLLCFKENFLSDIKSVDKFEKTIALLKKCPSDNNLTIISFSNFVKKKDAPETYSLFKKYVHKNLEIYALKRKIDLSFQLAVISPWMLLISAAFLSIDPHSSFWGYNLLAGAIGTGVAGLITYCSHREISSKHSKKIHQLNIESDELNLKIQNRNNSTNQINNQLNNEKINDHQPNPKHIMEESVSNTNTDIKKLKIEKQRNEHKLSLPNLEETPSLTFKL